MPHLVPQTPPLKNTKGINLKSAIRRKHRLAALTVL
jgi:hypothetical protein